MLKGYFWAFFLLTIVSFVQAEDFLDSELLEREDRILGGATSTSSIDRGAVASVRLANIQGHFHICGGFIVNKRWVATAAQCLTYQTINNTVVAVGTTGIAAGVTYDISEIVKHDNYNELNLNNDIALLRTAQEIIFSGNTIRLAPLNTQAVTGTVTILGWGRNAVGSTLSATLLETTFTIVAHATCINSFPLIGRRFITDNRHICTSRTGVATCPGDAGSPIFFNGLVVGIVSWVEPCVAGQVNVNTRISFYVKWISDLTRNDN